MIISGIKAAAKIIKGIFKPKPKPPLPPKPPAPPK
jgi:hypothetical protein